jgi:hypothetical protein
MSSYFVQLKECFDKLKTNELSIVTLEEGRGSSNKFRTIVSLDGKSLYADGYGNSKKDSKVQACRNSINILVKTRPDVASYFEYLNEPPSH